MNGGAIREIFVRMGLDFDSSGAKKADSAIQGLISSAKSLGLAFGVGVLANGIKSFISDNLKIASNLADMGERLGVSTDLLQKYGHVAELVGVSSESVGKAIGFLNKNLGDAQLGGKQAQTVFAKLGIGLKNSDGSWKNSEQIIGEFSDRMSKLPNIAQKIAFAQKLLGRGGKELATVFGQGSEAINAQIKEFVDLGGVIDEKTLKRLDAVEDRFHTLSKAMRGIKLRALETMLPILISIQKATSNAVKLFNKLNEEFGIMRPLLYGIGAAILALGGYILATFAPAIATVGLAVAAFMAIGLAVDDLIALFKGEKSAIGAFLVEFLGFDDAKSLVQTIRDTFKGLVTLIKAPETRAAISDTLKIFTAGVLGAIDVVRVLYHLFAAFLKLRGGIGNTTDPLAASMAELQKISDQKSLSLGFADKHPLSSMQNAPIPANAPLSVVNPQLQSFLNPNVSMSQAQSLQTFDPYAFTQMGRQLPINNIANSNTTNRSSSKKVTNNITINGNDTGSMKAALREVLSDEYNSTMEGMSQEGLDDEGEF